MIRPEPPEKLDFYPFIDERVELAQELGILSHPSEAKEFGDTIDPPSNEELLTYLNEKYGWAVEKGGTGEKKVFHANSVWSLERAFRAADQVMKQPGREPEDWWIYRFIKDTGSGKIRALDQVTRLPEWMALHAKHFGQDTDTDNA